MHFTQIHVSLQFIRLTQSLQQIHKKGVQDNSWDIISNAAGYRCVPHQLSCNTNGFHSRERNQGVDERRLKGDYYVFSSFPPLPVGFSLCIGLNQDFKCLGFFPYIVLCWKVSLLTEKVVGFIFAVSFFSWKLHWNQYGSVKFSSFYEILILMKPYLAVNIPMSSNENHIKHFWTSETIRLL